MLYFNYTTYNIKRYINSIEQTTMEYEILVTKESYYKAILMTVNFNLRLSDLELDIISTMLQNDLTIVNIDTRDLIRKVLNKDKFITNNYIKRLRDKGILLERPNDKKFYLNPNILELVKDSRITFKFTLNEEINDDN